MTSMKTTGTERPLRGSRIRLRVFALMWVLVLLNFVDRSALSISLPSISREFHISPAVQGWLLGSFFWTYLLLQIPGGWLLDRFGPRRVVSWAGGLWGVFQLLGGLVSGGVLLTATRLGLGASEAPVFPAGAKLNANWLPPAERARGATFVDMAGPFGAAVGGVIVTALIGFTGSWRWAFIITGALTIAVSVLNGLYLRDSPEQHPGVDAAELDHIRGGSAPADLDGAQDALPTVGDYARSRSFWGLWLGRLGWATVWWGIISWTPTYLSDELGFDLKALGWGTFLVYGFGVLGELLSGQVTDRFRNRSDNPNRVMRAVLGVSGGGSVLAILAIPLVQDGYAALALLAAAVFFNQMGGIYWAIPAWLAPRRQVGKVGSVMNVASSAGGGLAPVVMGYSIAAAGGGYGGAFVFLAVAAAVFLAGSMVIDFRRPLARTRA